MTPPTTRRIGVDAGVSLVVGEWPGSMEPTFVLAHGLASNAELWWGTADRLAELGHSCAAVDQRGHGRSDKPEVGYTLDGACADLLAVLDALDPPGRVILAGQSWGANVVLELGWRHPERIAGVVCVDGGTIELSSRFPDWESCAAALAPPQLVGTPRADIERFMREMHPDWPEAGIQAALANFEVRPDGTVAPHLSFDHHMQLLRALWEHRPSTRYAEMKVPVLLVPADDGTASQWVADKHQSVDDAVRAMPQARAHWFAPADHDVHAQYPVELGDLLHEEATTGVLS